MKKRLLIVLFLAAGIWLAVRYWPMEKVVAVDPNWPMFDNNAVDRLEFKNLNGEHTAVRRDGQYYILHNGIEYRGINERLTEIVTYINNYQPKRRLEGIAKEKLGGFGLDNATIRFTVVTGEKRWAMDLGNQNPEKSGFYAMYSGSDDVLIVPPGFNEKIGRKFDLFVDKRMLNFEPQKMTELRVKGARGTTFTIGFKKGLYSFVEPESLRSMILDQKAAGEYVNTIANMIGDKFLEDGVDKDKLPLEATFEVMLQGSEQPLVIEIHKADSAKDETHIVESTHHPVPYTAKEANVKRMFIDPEELRSKAIVHMDMNAAGKMKFVELSADGKKTLSVTRSGSDWLNDKTNKPMAGLSVLLWKLTELKYIADPAAEVQDTAKSAFTWEISGPEGEAMATVSFYRDSAFPEGQIWAEVLGNPKFYPVDDEILKELETLQ